MFTTNQQVKEVRNNQIVINVIQCNGYINQNVTNSYIFLNPFNNQMSDFNTTFSLSSRTVIAIFGNIF